MSAWLLLCVAAALGAPVDALPPLVRDLYLKGQSLEAKGELGRAATAYRMTWSQERTWTQALLDEARVLEMAGQEDAALEALRRAPYDADAAEAEARLLLDLGDDRAAADVVSRLLALRPEWPEGFLLRARALAASDPGGAEVALRRYLGAKDGELDLDVIPVGTAIVRGLAALGHDDEAAELAAHVLERAPESDALEVLRSVLVEREVADAAAALARAAGVPLSPTGVQEVREARAALFAGDPQRAAALLQELLEREPRAPVAWSALSLVEEARDDVGAAVAAARMAEELDPLDADVSARVGDLMVAHYGGRLDVAAARAYGRAVQRRGADPELWLRKGRAERRAGWVTPCMSSFRRVIALSGDGALADEARQALEDLARPLPAVVQAPAGDAGRPPAIPQEAWTALHVAWAWQRRAGEEGALERAATEVARARALAPEWTRAINLDAAIRLDRGDDAGALAEYRHSLALKPEQGAVWRMVAVLLRSAGEPEGADAALQRAASLGEPTAVLAHAERLAQGWHLWGAQEELERYKQRSVEHPERVERLTQQIVGRKRILAASGVAGAGLLVGGPVVWRARARAGVGLDALLTRAPRTYPDVARILAATRHEVIKHHTTVLGAVADGLEADDAEPACWAEERLFGAGGAVSVFWSHMDELRAVAEGVGLRLNLRHRDAELGPLVVAMDELTALEGRLAAQIPGRLHRLDDAINHDGYRALGRRLASFCTLVVDEALLSEAFERARAETRAAVRLEMPVGPSGKVVRMYRQDLLDVLVNLLRNGIEATVAAGAERVGLAVGVDEDWVTGLQRVEIRVLDDAPAPLTTAQIRGRFIGRGLGLAVDLVTRAAGSIHVESEPGWSKAVVVRLPQVEAEEMA